MTFNVKSKFVLLHFLLAMQSISMFDIDINDHEYLSPLNTYLLRIPVGAHAWIRGNFNIGDIHLEADSVKPYASKS